MVEICKERQATEREVLHGKHEDKGFMQKGLTMVG